MKRTILACLLAMSGFANAQDTTGQAWLSVHGASYHLDRSQQWNETNPGIGAEYQAASTVSLLAGAYKNSYSRTTTYAGIGWQPEALKLGPVQLGAVAGLATGYNLPFIAFARASIDCKAFVIDVIAAPPAEKNGSAMLGFSVRIPLN